MFEFAGSVQWMPATSSPAFPAPFFVPQLSRIRPVFVRQFIEEDVGMRFRLVRDAFQRFGVFLTKLPV